jgi:replicative DNA helicase
MSQLSGNLPPYDEKTEQEALGAVLINPSQALELRMGWFYLQRHKTLCAAILEMASDGIQINEITLHSYLRQRQISEDAGGLAYINACRDAAPSSLHFDYAKPILRNLESDRKWFGLTGKISSHIHEGKSGADLNGAVEPLVMEIFQQEDSLDQKSLKEETEDVFRQIKERCKNGNKLAGLPTGFPRLDEKIGGLHGGAVYVIGARPGVGKTSFVTRIASHLSIEKGATVAFFSLEMTSSELIERILSDTANVPLSNVISGNLESYEIERLKESSEALVNCPLIIDDQTTSIMTMRAKARVWKIQKDLRAIFIDYLQLAELGRKSDNSYQAVTEISKEIKRMAKELNIPVVALAQLNRETAKSGDRPEPHNLRESGQIEQDSHACIMLHHGEGTTEEMTGLIDVCAYVAKNRNGPRGTVKMKFNQPFVRYSERPI